MYSNKICCELDFNNEMEDDINDMATMNNYINCKSEALRKTACRNLFALVCSLAMQTVIATDRTKKLDMWVKLKQSFNDVMDNYHLTFDGNTRVLSYFGDVWPTAFKNYVIGRFNATISAKFRKELDKDSQNGNEDLKRVWYIGYIIEQEVDEVKRYINNVLNPLFKDIPSGRSVQQLLNAIRRNIWCTECVKKARKSAHQKILYTKKTGEKSLTISSLLIIKPQGDFHKSSAQICRLRFLLIFS